MSLHLRGSILSNLNEIVELHEEILGALHRVVPDSEYSQKDLNPSLATGKPRGHRRFSSLDLVPESALPHLQQIPGFVAEPRVGGEVARVFKNKVSQ